MKLHVLVNSFNDAKTMGDCLNSVINQTYQDIDIEIFDRGSTDMSRSVIEQYMKSDKRITLSRREENYEAIFAIDARNKLMHLNFFEIAMNHFKKYSKVGICTGIIQSFNEKNEYLGSLGKINGSGEQNAFSFSGNKEMSLISRDKLDVANTLLPIQSSIVRSAMGDIVFIHQTVLRFNDDPKKIEGVVFKNYAPVEKPTEALPKDVKNPPKKSRGRPKGALNKPKTSTIVDKTEPVTSL